MTETDMATLEEELRHFREEKEKIRKIIRQIGGAKSAKREKMVTLVFGITVLVLFLLDILRHFLWEAIPLPPLFSLAIGVLLVYHSPAPVGFDNPTGRRSGFGNPDRALTVHLNREWV